MLGSEALIASTSSLDVSHFSFYFIFNSCEGLISYASCVQISIDSRAVLWCEKKKHVILSSLGECISGCLGMISNLVAKSHPWVASYNVCIKNNSIQRCIQTGNCVRHLLHQCTVAMRVIFGLPGHSYQVFAIKCGNTFWLPDVAL